MSDVNVDLVLCLGAESLHPSLVQAGLAAHAVADVAELLRPSSDLAPRAIVLGEAAVVGIDLDGLMPQIREAWPLVDVLLWAPLASADLVRRALNAGVRDVLLSRSPRVACAAVVDVIEAQQLLPRTANVGDHHDVDQAFDQMISRSPAMYDLFDTAAQVAQASAAVLILGETGTGKELLARAIHKRSRRTGRFVALNCAAVPESLIDSQLFGHVEGAFTGATRPKPGLFRHAEGGTLLLDEAGNVPLPVQYRLLRVLQEGLVRPVGGTTEEPVNVRVIAATSAPLEARVREGTFREDLFYRLDVIRLVIPPLRDRPSDIVFLFAHFARRYAEEYGLQRPDVTDSFLDALVSHQWPGNVRQLENLAERLVLTEGDTVVTADRFQDLMAFKSPSAASDRPFPLASAQADIALDRPMREALAPHIAALERAYLIGALEQTRGRVMEAAEIAGISRRTFSRMLSRLDLDKSTYRWPRDTEAATDEDVPSREA